jgi:hypothetical protein
MHSFKPDIAVDLSFSVIWQELPSSQKQCRLLEREIQHDYLMELCPQILCHPGEIALYRPAIHLNEDKNVTLPKSYSEKLFCQYYYYDQLCEMKTINAQDRYLLSRWQGLCQF